MQRQRIEIAKKTGRCKGRLVNYAADAKNSHDHMNYHVIANKLKLVELFKKVFEYTGVTRDAVYRIKNELD